MDYNWPEIVEKRVNKFADSKGLKGKERDLFIKKSYELFDKSRVPIYEPAGLLAAHSMGEPATQLILRTKHYAGAAEVSIGSGIERLEALVDARSKTKYPILTIIIKKGFPTDEKNMRKYLKQVIFKKLSDICDVKEDLSSNKIKIIFKKDLVKELGLNAESIKEAIKTVTKVKGTIIKEGLEYEFNDVSLVTIRKYLLKMTGLNIAGIEGIEDAIVVEENGVPAIKAQGTNLKAIAKLDFVDAEKTYSNDIFEAHKVLGIEAARNLLVQEIFNVYNDAGIGLDLRHIYLLADSMCYDGTVKGVVRTGIVSTKASVLAKAAFEQTEKVIFDAAFNKETEKFKGVVENVMAGLPIKVGIGNIELAMDFSKGDKIKASAKPKKEVKEEKVVKEKPIKAEKIEKPAKTKKEIKEKPVKKVVKKK